MEEYYYIISLKHTKAKDSIFTFWGPGDAGYMYRKEQAGIYSETLVDKNKDYYNNPESTLAVSNKKIKDMWSKVKLYGAETVVLLNNSTNRKILGITLKQLKEGKTDIRKSDWVVIK